METWLDIFYILIFSHCGVSGSPPVQRYISSVSGRLELSEEKILQKGVCVVCAGIIKYVGQASPSHVFLGCLCRCERRALGKGEEWLACLSFWVYREKKNTTLINELWFGAREKKGWSTGAISTTEPSSHGTVKKRRNPMSNVNMLISTFWNSSSLLKLFLMVMSAGSSSRQRKTTIYCMTPSIRTGGTVF